jgi:hypothetical protein
LGKRYDEFEPAGTVFAYDHRGSDRGNALQLPIHEQLAMNVFGAFED